MRDDLQIPIPGAPANQRRAAPTTRTGRDFSKKEMVYDLLLDRLMTAHYRFGDRLLVKDITRELQLSKQPIMAALNALSVDGFLKIIAQVGCEVVSPTVEEISDFYRMFGGTEGLVCELAASRRSSKDLDRLRAIDARIGVLKASGAADAGEQYRLLNRRFHQLLHEMAHSTLVEQQLDRLLSMSDFFISQSVGFFPHMNAAIDEHGTLIDALEQGSPERARAAAEAHVASSAAEVVRGLQGRQGAVLRA